MLPATKQPGLFQRAKPPEGRHWESKAKYVKVTINNNKNNIFVGNFKAICWIFSPTPWDSNTPIPARLLYHCKPWSKITTIQKKNPQHWPLGTVISQFWPENRILRQQLRILCVYIYIYHTLDSTIGKKHDRWFSFVFLCFFFAFAEFFVRFW